MSIFTPGSGSVRDFLLEVTKGNVPGHSQTAVIGLSTFINDTAFQDIWEVDGSLVYLAAADKLEILSDSANDTLAGTGAQTVLISGLDENYVEQSQLVELNGTTPVETDDDFLRFRQLTVATVGSGDENEGTITVRTKTSGDTQGVILPDKGISFNSHFTVPAEKVAIILQAASFIPKDDDIRLLNRIRPLNGMFLAGGEIGLYQGESVVAFRAFPVLPPKTDLKSTALSPVNSHGEASINIEILLVDVEVFPNALLQMF